MANDAPRTKEKEVRTAEIVQAAREVFLSRGFQAATVQEIAEKAGIAKGTVYLYYKGKDDLYSALLLPSLEFLNERFSAVLEEVQSGQFESGEELLNALGDVFIDLQNRDPEMAMIYQGFQIGTFVTSISEDTLGRLSGFGRRNFQIFREICTKGIELGLIRDLEVVKAVDAIWGLFLGVAQVEWNKMKFTGKNHFQETLRYALSMMCSGVCLTPEATTRRGRKGRRSSASARAT